MVVVTTRNYTSAFSMIGQTDLIMMAPEILVSEGIRMTGLQSFELPVPIAPVAIRMAWHPRSDADPAHVWLRSRVRGILLPGDAGSGRPPGQPHH